MLWVEDGEAQTVTDERGVGERHLEPPHSGRAPHPLVVAVQVERDMPAGARLSFTVFHPQRAKHATQYTCRVDGAKMTGTCHEAGDVTNHWAWGGCLQPSNG